MSNFDDVKIYGSGAGSDGGVQTDHNLNLGGYRSASEIQSLSVFGAMEHVSVLRAGGANIPGAGALESDGAGRVRWTAPGSYAAGAWAALNDGATVVLPDGVYPDRGVRVSRSGAVPKAGSRTIKFLETYNGGMGLPNVDDASRIAGEDSYRCVFVRNESGMSIPFLRLYPVSGVKIAREDPSAPDGYVQTIASGHTAPAGRTWVDSSGTIDIFEWTAGAMLGLWVWRAVAAGASAAARVENCVGIEHIL